MRFDIGKEQGAGHWAVDHQRRRHADEPQSGNECRGLPVRLRNCPGDPPGQGRAGARACHVGRHAGFVEENQVCGIELRLLRLPGCPRGADIPPIPLSGMQGIFLAADAMALEKPCDRRLADLTFHACSTGRGSPAASDWVSPRSSAAANAGAPQWRPNVARHRSAADQCVRCAATAAPASTQSSG